jgi:hypothetical protein
MRGGKIEKGAIQELVDLTPESIDRVEKVWLTSEDHQ